MFDRSIIIMLLLLYLVYFIGLSCEFPQSHAENGAFDNLNLTENECKDGWPKKLIPIDSDWITVCFPNNIITDRGNKANKKPSRRFKVENSSGDDDLCEPCKKEGSCKESIEFNWIKLKNIGLGQIEVESNLLSGRKFSFEEIGCHHQNVEKIRHELSNGAFLSDLLNGEAKIEYFLFLLPTLGSYIAKDTVHKTAQPAPIYTSTETSTVATTAIQTQTPIKRSINYSTKMAKSVTNQTTIKFRAKVREDDAETLVISLLHDAPEFHPFLGETVLRMEVNFTTYLNDSKVFRGAYTNGSWFNNGTWTAESKEMFKLGEELTCTMLLTATGITKIISVTVLINGRKLGEFAGNWPIWAVNWLQIAGDITIVDPPAIEYGIEGPLFKRELKHLLYGDDDLCLEGTVIDGFNSEKQGKYFAIHLYHGAQERNDLYSSIIVRAQMDGSDFGVGVLVLYIYPDNGDQTTVDTVFPERRELTMSQNGKLYNYELNGNQRFFVKIKARGNGYSLYINSSIVLSFDDPFVPSWTAEWLTVYGGLNVTLGADSEQCNGTGQKELPANIYQLYPDKLLKVGDEIGVTGQINATMVEISMFRKALDWNAYFGQTVLRIQVSTDILNCNSYSQKKWAFPSPLHVPLIQPLISEQNFTLKIAVMEKFYAISYGDEGLVTRYPHVMPIWAVHYITVKGLKLPNITIQP